MRCEFSVEPVKAAMQVSSLASPAMTACSSGGEREIEGDEHLRHGGGHAFERGGCRGSDASRLGFQIAVVEQAERAEATSTR